MVYNILVTLSGHVTLWKPREFVVYYLFAAAFGRRMSSSTQFILAVKQSKSSRKKGSSPTLTAMENESRHSAMSILKLARNNVTVINSRRVSFFHASGQNLHFIK